MNGGVNGAISAEGWQVMTVGGMRAARAENNQTHADAELMLAAAMGNVTIAKLHEAFSQWWYPDVYCDFWDIPVAADGTHPAIIRQPFTFPGIVRLKKLLLMDPGGVYPSRLDVIVEKFTHRAFTLSSARPELGPFAFRLMGGSDVVFTNPDTANAATVYIEWEMVNMAISVQRDTQ